MNSIQSDRSTNSRHCSMFYSLDTHADNERRRKVIDKFRAGNWQPKQLGMFEAWSMRRRGRRDGRLGLPRQNSDGEWLSPQIEQELSWLNEMTQRVWQRFSAVTANLYIESKKLQLHLEQLKTKFESVSDCSRYIGEEDIDASVVRIRRQIERAEIAEAEIRLAEKLQEISELESQTKYVCTQAKSRTRQRLALYWLGCLRTNPNSEQMPPAPPLSHDTEMKI
jgi:hypothetical protein